MDRMVAKGGRRLGVDRHDKASLKLIFGINFLAGRRFLGVQRQDGTGSPRGGRKSADKNADGRQLFAGPALPALKIGRGNRALTIVGVW
jgi:hypothetical protein